MSRSAIPAFESREGLEADGIMDSDVWEALNGNNRGQVLRSYRVTEEDTGGLTHELPEDYAELAEMVSEGETCENPYLLLSLSHLSTISKAGR